MSNVERDFAVDRPYLVIRASAGTGKTHQLTSRYIALLHAGVPVDAILATTFTRKAAGEIADRVIMWLAQAATDPTKFQELAEAIPAGDLTPPRCLQLLAQVTKNLHRLRVMTLDAFFAQLAVAQSLELGLPPGWQMVDDAEHQRRRAHAIQAVLANNPERDVTRIMHLVAGGAADRQVSDLIHTKATNLHETWRQSDEAAWRCVPRPKPFAAEEIAAMLGQLKAAPLPDHRTAIKSHQTTCDAVAADDWLGFISKGIGKNVADGQATFQKKPIPAETVDVYDRLVQHARAVLLNEFASQNEGTCELVAAYDTQHQRVIRDSGRLSFEDVKHSLTANASAGDELAFRLDGPIHHLLLDEFQDTSPEQWQVLEPLARRCAHDPGGTFFAVGDEKQAIYGWRGGSAEIFDVLQQQLEQQLHKKTLDRSFRSRQAIIDVVNQIFQNLLAHKKLDDDRRAVEKWAARFQRHATAIVEKPGYVTLEAAPEADEGDKQLHATLRYTAERIKQLAERHPTRTIGVLVRANLPVARLIHELTMLKVPASQEGGNPLTDSAAVQVLLSVLTVADHPGDTASWFHVAHSPVAEFFGTRADASPAERAAISGRWRSELLAGGYGATLARWAQALVPHCPPRERSRLEQMVDLGHRYDEFANLRPGDFVALVAELRIEARQATPVRVMTIHQAKGLEFDIVVVTDLNSTLVQPSDHATRRDGIVGRLNAVCLHRDQHLRNLLPKDLQTMFNDARDREIDEALCRMYVAVTRARCALHMIVDPPGKPGKRPADLLRCALVPDDADTDGRLLYEHGESNWDELEESGVQRREAGGGSPEIRRVELAEGGPPLRRWVAPSSLEGGSQRDPSAVFRAGRAQATGWGSLIHRWFEQIEWLDDGLPDQQKLLQLARQHATTHDVNKPLARFYEILRDGPIAQLLQRTNYDTPDVKVYRELPSAGEQGEDLVGGNIDRLVVTFENGQPLAADIIDFKSDAIDQTELAARVEHYRPQLAAYQSAVASMFRLPADAITSRLAFTELNRVVVT